MGFWAAVPMIGSLLDSIFGGIDKISTSDEEKLKLKQEIMATAAPVITLLIEAQKSFDQMRTQVELAAIQSGDTFVRRVRPALMVGTFIAWAGIEGYVMYLVGPQVEYLQAAAERAFWAFGLIGGLFTATRGVEKGVMRWAQGKNGNGNGR